MTAHHHHHHRPEDQSGEPAAQFQAQPAGPSAERRSLALWLSVGGIMAVIVAMWALLLPSQLGGLSLTGKDAIDRWHVLSPDRGQTPSFQQTLDRLHQQLERLSAGTEASLAKPAAPPVAKPAIDVRLLRQKLEAVSNPAPTPATNTSHESPK